MKINFDKIVFEFFNSLRVYLKEILTELGLRYKQSCKCCGRNQCIIWKVSDKLWYTLPKKWHNTTLCIECFTKLCNIELKRSDFDLLIF